MIAEARIIPMTFSNSIKFKNNDNGKILLHSANRITVVKLNDIICCKSHSNYTIFFLVGNKQEVVTKTLKSCEDSLSFNHFFRIHNSSIINLNRIEQIHKNGIVIVSLEDGVKVEVSRRKRDEFFTKIEEYFLRA